METRRKVRQGTKEGKENRVEAGVKSFAWLLPTLRGGCKAACNKVGLLLTLRTDVTFHRDGLYPWLLSYQFLFLFFHISPTNKRKNFNSRLSLICFVLGIGIKRFEDKMFMVILKKKVIKDYWLNNISFFIIDCPSRDISFFLELQYIFSMFCPNKMNFII